MFGSIQPLGVSPKAKIGKQNTVWGPATSSPGRTSYFWLWTFVFCQANRSPARKIWLSSIQRVKKKQKTVGRHFPPTWHKHYNEVSVGWSLFFGWVFLQVENRIFPGVGNLFSSAQECICAHINGSCGRAAFQHVPFETHTVNFYLQDEPQTRFFPGFWQFLLFIDHKMCEEV